jgi:hypothetical protein
MYNRGKITKRYQRNLPNKKTDLYQDVNFMKKEIIHAVLSLELVGQNAK